MEMSPVCEQAAGGVVATLNLESAAQVSEVVFFCFFFGQSPMHYFEKCFES